jgi:hypothetical protein
MVLYKLIYAEVSLGIFAQASSVLKERSLNDQR